MISDFDLGWIVGFYEGEGWIGCTIYRRKYGKNKEKSCQVICPRCSIGQKDVTPLKRLQELLGYGVLCQGKDGFWRWQMSHKDAVRFATLIRGRVQSEYKAMQVEQFFKSLEEWKWTKHKVGRRYDELQRSSI